MTAISPAARRVLHAISDAARAGAPCPSNVALGYAAGISDVTARKYIQALRAAGELDIEYGANSNLRRAIVPGVGATAWSPGGRRGMSDLMPTALRDADEIFAGVRFEDAPVQRATGRAPLPLTHVPTQVAGDWR
jgi:hypothetical protein